MIALAGFAAETLWLDKWCDPSDLENPDAMSPPDWQSAGCEPGKPDALLIELLPYTENILILHWFNVKRTARALLDQCKAGDNPPDKIIRATEP